MSLRHLAESRAMLEKVVVSSEEFNYREAKLALVALEKKIRELGRIQKQLQKQLRVSQNVHWVDFQSSKVPVPSNS